MSIKYKLIITYLILIIFTVSTLGFVIGKKSNETVSNKAKDNGECITNMINDLIEGRNELLTKNVSSNLNLVEKLLHKFHDFSVNNSESLKVGEYKLPVLYASGERVTLDNTIVDKIKESTGAISSIFLLNDNKLIRVSTNVIKDSQRVEGTYISHDSDVYNKIIKNDKYCGKAIVEGENYITIYKPLLDKDKNVIGAIGLGYKILDDYLEKSITDIKIGQTGYIYIMDSKANEIVHPIHKGNNIDNYDFANEIISTKNGTIEYTYEGVQKLAYYKYFESWDWYIVCTTNYDDFNSSWAEILHTLIFSVLVISIIGIIMALLMANNLVKPINKLKLYMEVASTGDLTVQSDINNKNEIGILSNSFNKMISENKRLLEETLQYDKLKTEFMSNMSHELRTPLNIIFSTVQLFSLYIKKGENFNVDKLDQNVSIMKQNCYRLLRLVNNLIDITKIDSGFMELDLKNKNIVEVVEEITLLTAEYIKNMSRTIIFDTDVEEKIMSFDEEKIERILLNLISNATKFTKPGDKIEVGLYDRDNYIVISVKDNGIGIPLPKLSQIFERFKQVDSLLNRSHEGSGIGLSIVKSLIEMHGGTINVKSKYQQGTEFIISLPVKLVSDNSDEEVNMDLTRDTNIEKIHIEFSDIYS